MSAPSSSARATRRAALRSAFATGTGREPWPHQLEAVSKLLSLLLSEGEAYAETGIYGHRNFLIQHGTGSGKSFTMALLAWALRSLHGQSACEGSRFALVLLLSDRRQLDQQLGDACAGFLGRNGVPLTEVRRCDGRSDDLIKVLGDVAVACCSGCRVVVTTKQRFDASFGRKGEAFGMLEPILRQGRVAIVCEEAHRSHFLGSCTPGAVNRLFGSHRLHGAATQVGLQPRKITYVGFTATPDDRALRLFGARLELGSRLRTWRPVHSYHVGDAEKDGVVINVLTDYARVEVQKEGPAAGPSERASWILGDFAEKRGLLPEPLKSRCAAMLVCKSRAEVVRWVDALRASIGEADRFAPHAPLACKGIFGFFSGALGDEHESEERLNGGLRLYEACSVARVIVVCRKLETGYDNPDLCVIYVDRVLVGTKQIVQVLSRVNRQAVGKRAFVVDFCNDPDQISAAFDEFKQEVVACSEPLKTAAVARFGSVLDRLGALLDGGVGVGAGPAASQAEKDVQDYVLLCEELGVPRPEGVLDFLNAAVRAARTSEGRGQQPSWSGPLAFVEETVAKRQLLRVVPSSRYGGFGRLPPPPVSAKPCAELEAPLRVSMRACASRIGRTVKYARCKLVIDASHLQATLCGAVEDIEALLATSDRYISYFSETMENRRADQELPYPVFIITKGRAESALLGWQARHCLGQARVGEQSVPVVVVVEPQEECAYRASWPSALLLVLPRAAETAIGYTRWVVQQLCTASRDPATGRVFRLPFAWMADDLMSAFYKLARPLRTADHRVLVALADRGFREAFLVVQRHPEICRMALAGFLRDRGTAKLIKLDWVVDKSMTMQKVVLLNLPRLQELGVEYCLQLRKSEDLAMCYDILKRSGGHILKCQCYTYRAIHLEKGGAEEVRIESRSNSVPTVGELVQGGNLLDLKANHRVAAEALLDWLRSAKPGGHEDDSVEVPDGPLASRYVESVLEHLPWPESVTRMNVMPAGMTSIKALCLGAVRTYSGDVTCSRWTRRLPTIARLLAKFAAQGIPEFKYTSIQLNMNYCAKLHVDANNVGPSYIIGFGNYEGGQLWVMDEDGNVPVTVTSPIRGYPLVRLGDKLMGKTHDIKGKWLRFDGRVPHCALPFKAGNTRISLVYFSRKGCQALTADARQYLLAIGFPLPDSSWLEANSQSRAALTMSPQSTRALRSQRRRGEPYASEGSEDVVDEIREAGGLGELDFIDDTDVGGVAEARVVAKAVDEADRAAQALRQRLASAAPHLATARLAAIAARIRDGGAKPTRRRLWPHSRAARHMVLHALPESASRCMARVWACGEGAQCKHKRGRGCGDLCRFHWRQDGGPPVHGRVDGPLPKDRFGSGRSHGRARPLAPRSILRRLGATSCHEAGQDTTPISRASAGASSAAAAWQASEALATRAATKAAVGAAAGEADGSDVEAAGAAADAAGKQCSLKCWVACDSCGHWSATSAVFAQAHGGDIPFACVDVGAQCGAKRIRRSGCA